MTHRRASQMLQGEDGFTLIELLVVMVISMVVIFATLQTLDGFTSNTARQTRLVDAFLDRTRAEYDSLL